MKNAKKINTRLRIIASTSLILCLAVWAVSCKHKITSNLPYYNSPDFTPHWQIPVKNDHHISDFSGYNQEGKTITQAALSQHITLVNFFFTGCGSICPKMTQNLKWVADSFMNEPKFQLLSFTVTPWIDSLPRLQKFAKKYHIKAPQWHLLNGEKKEIYTLARRSFFAEEEPGFDKNSNEFLHTELVLLVDENLRLRGVYNGTQRLDAEKMIEDIHLLLNTEAKP